MTPTEYRMSVEKIVILRALQLGDLLCSVPTLRALRHGFPEAEITLVGLPWAAEFVGRFSAYLDHFIEFPGFPGLPEQEARLDEYPEFLATVQERHFDLAIQLHGSGSIVNTLTVLFGAKRNAGFYLSGHYCPDEKLFVPYLDYGPEILRLLRICDAFGIKPMGTHLEFPLTEKDSESYLQIERIYGLGSKEIVCIHPGSRHPERRWPSEWFAKTADLLAGRGYQVVLTGTPSEADITAKVAAQAKAAVINLAGQTNLGSLGVLLTKSKVLICNDTGVSHLADALNVPSMVLFSTPDPEQWGPMNRQLHQVFLRSSNTTPEMILSAVDRMPAQEVVHVT